MDTKLFVEAAAEIRGRFFSLIDSLSTLRSLTTLEVRHREETALLGDALHVLTQHQAMDRCAIFMLHDGEPVFAAGHDWPDCFSGPEGRRGVDTELIARVLRTGESASCADCAGGKLFHARPAATQAPDGAFICVPILVRGEALGVVSVYHPHTNAFEAWHEHTLTLFCGVLAHMLDNNRLLRGMEDAVEDRTRQLEAALREAQQLKRRYEQLSNVDELTTLHNRRFFFPEAEATLSRCTRHGHPFCMLLMDVDRFKHVNDNHGHCAGDRVLRDIADALKAQIREGDIIARFGGEEFVIALPNTALEGALLLAERIRATVSELRWPLGDDEIKVTLSLGLATLGEGHSGDSKSVLDTLVGEADKAMYGAKDHGRNQVQTFTEPALSA